MLQVALHSGLQTFGLIIFYFIAIFLSLDPSDSNLIVQETPAWALIELA